MERHIIVLLLFFFTTGCSFNPFTTNNKLTGSIGSTAVGAGIGAGSMLALHAPKGLVYAVGAGGAALGYYASTLRFDAGGVIKSGGQVFTVGQYVTIEIPTDRVFDTNSAELLDEAAPILDSAVDVLNRYPENNIMVSGNTSGFGTSKFEQQLSEARAREVAAYLWSHGINNFQQQSIHMRKLIYVGYGNYFPIANNIRAESIRQNSRIQITAYPRTAQLHLDKRHKVFNNIGDINEPPLYKRDEPIDFNRVFPPGKILPEAFGSRRQDFKDVIQEGRQENLISPQSPTDYNAIAKTEPVVSPRVKKLFAYKAEGYKGDGA